jgi:nitrite reductase (NO-forming)
MGTEGGGLIVVDTHRRTPPPRSAPINRQPASQQSDPSSRLVEPPGGLPPVDREFSVVQGDWYTAGAFGASGHQAFDNNKALAEAPEYFTLNGHVAALTNLFPLHASVGETVRIYFDDGVPNVAANFHIIGEIFDKVYTGSPDTFTANEETAVIAPGSAAIFEQTLEEPGEYLLVDMPCSG